MGEKSNLSFPFHVTKGKRFYILLRASLANSFFCFFGWCIHLLLLPPSLLKGGTWSLIGRGLKKRDKKILQIRELETKFFSENLFKKKYNIRNNKYQIPSKQSHWDDADCAYAFLPVTSLSFWQTGTRSQIDSAFCFAFVNFFYDTRGVLDI